MERKLVSAREMDTVKPFVMHTEPPYILTWEEICKKIPNMRVLHISATNPRPERH